MIPVVDLTQPREVVVADLLHAYGELGFAYLTGHAIDPAIVADVFAASAEFHALPLDVRMRIELDANHRGFIPIDTSTDRTSTLAEVTKPNQSESFMMMRESEPGEYLAGPNQWPDLPGFRERLERYHDAMWQLGLRLVDLVADALGDASGGEGELRAAFDPPTTWLRLLHYPPVPESAPGDLYGSAPHCDFGFLTVLAQDDVGGLQVQTPAGEWVDVPPRPGAFVMNVGDMLHRWSNGRLRSTPHRVLNRVGRERFSVPFFFDPHVTTVIRPLASCVTLDRPAAFDPIEFGTFVRTQLESTYDAHTPGL